MGRLRVWRCVLGVVFLIWLIAPAVGSDTAKEKRWADQIVDTLIDGDAFWLEAHTTKFLGIYTESKTKPAKGAVIVIHGTGVHPDWKDVIQPLRIGLTEQGWATLSVQMPILGNEAKYNDYAPLFPEIPPRMQASVEYLKTKGYTKIAVVGHSFGAQMAAYYLASQSGAIRGLVAVGQAGTQYDIPGTRYFDLLPRVKIPILDLYGSEDLDYIVASAALRKENAAKAGISRYDQVMIPGANHFHQGKKTELIDAVSQWLDKNI